MVETRSAAARTLAAAVLVVVAVGALAGCGDDEGATGAADPSPRPTLLVDEDPDGSFEAIVSGATGLNAQGCVIIGDRLVVAPEGSRADDDGGTVHLAGYAPFTLGDDVELVGGQEELPVEDAHPEHVACSELGVDTVRVAVVAPGP